MKIAIITLGCKTNQAESMCMEHAFSNAGHMIVDIPERPDVCIINTCTVTSKADSQSRQLIQRAMRNNSRTIVTGCYAELNHGYLKKIDGDIEVIKNSNKSNIINIITQDISSNTINIYNPSRQRPIVKVQDGCNYSCSYCAIPMARGKSRSVPINEIMSNLKFYESQGYKEIVLTGIHLGTYGLDVIPKTSLKELIREILVNTEIPRIRLSSLEVKEIDEELLDLITHERICNHLHVPLQSGDDNVLKLMNRTYEIKEYLLGMDKIFNKLPDLSVGTDVIVGFPGEGRSEFNNTMNFIESIPFSYLHVFPYSRRLGTTASTLPEQVSEKTKKERAGLLRNLGIAKKIAYIEKHAGKTLNVIIEGNSAEGHIGTTSNYIKVSLMGENDIKKGMLAPASITEYKNGMAVGVIEKNLQPLNK